MAVYLITWDLNKEKQNYNQARLSFVSHLEQIDNVKDPNLDSVRFINTNSSADQVSDYLRQKLDDNDHLCVVRLKPGDYAGWLSKLVWDWIESK